MFKFLHAADIHLDSPMLGLGRYEGAPVDECRGAGRRALENLVTLAVAEQVGFVVIVGDLYDGDWPDYNTGLFFASQMAKLLDAKIPVYLIRGNHDAANRMTKDLRPLDNVRFLSDRKPETVHLDDFDAVIHGQSYPKSEVVDNLSLAYPGRASGKFNIGLLHTGVEGRDGHANYAPCNLTDLRHHGYDYWALGHIHKRETLIDSDPVVAFPGNLQGRSVRETGPKGCLLVTVDDANRATVETRWLDVLRWEVCRVDATGARDGDELLDRFRGALSLLLPKAEGRLLALRVEFHGACQAHGKTSADWPRWSSDLRLTATEAGAGRVWVEKVLAKTAPPPSPRSPDDDGPRAELAALLAELREDPEELKRLFDREMEDVRRKGPWMLEETNGPDRLRDLLDQVGPLLLGRIDGVAPAPEAASSAS